VLLALGLILAGCTVPTAPVGAPGARDVAGTGLELGQVFTLQYGGGATVYIDGTAHNVVRFDLVDDEGHVVATAYCANMDVYCSYGDKYQLVSASDYFKNGEDLQLKAALTYIENNYGYLKDSNLNGYNQLVQAVTWNIINHYAVTGISGDDANGTLFNAATYIISHLDNLMNDYSISTNVTMEGTGAANGNLYGPFNVSENAVLADVDFVLTFDQGGDSAKFVDAQGMEIPSVKPGEAFYVQVADGASGDFHFTANASLSKQYYYMDDFLLFLNVEDAARMDGQVKFQPLYQPVFQPLFQPLFSPNIKTYDYTCSGKFTITPAADQGIINIEKTVGGLNISVWAKTNGKDIASLITGFDLYKDRVKVNSAPVPVDANGMISFSGLTDGTYEVREVLTAAGGGVFEQAAPVTVTIVNGVQVSGSGFDKNAKYMGNTGNSWDVINAITRTVNGSTIPWQIYNFKVRNEATGIEYLSFCGNYGSSGLNEVQSNLWDLEPAKQAAITGMLNYIFAKYGSIDKWTAVALDSSNTAALDEPAQNTKLIAQIAIWLTIGNGLESVNLTNCPALNAAVQDVLTNGTTTAGSISIAFLAGVEYPFDIDAIQPQIVPIYDDTFNNMTKILPPPPPLPPPVSAVYSSVTATNAGNVPAILAGLNPKNGNPFYGDKKNADTPFVVPNSNHFVFAQLDRAALADGVVLQLLVGNKYDIVGTATVKLADGNLVISVDKMASGSIGAVAFNKEPVFSNGNIHSQKAADLAKFGALTGFNHDGKMTIPCPAGDTIYLYIHFDSLQFYL